LLSSRGLFGKRVTAKPDAKFLMMESIEFPNNTGKGRAASRSRREMLRLCACAAMASGFTSLLSTVEKASAMIYIPKQERMWDSWMLYHKETFYLFHL
jgi:hypothetical protein